METQTRPLPRAGEHALTPADRIFYAALLVLLIFVLFNVDGGMFQITRVISDSTLEATR